MIVFNDVKDLNKTHSELKKKGYTISEALLFVVSQVCEDFEKGTIVEQYYDKKTKRAIEICVSVYKEEE